uniref:MFS domain-containing protein n=1 Tax=Rhabditophanes sp. KR3021 TaxID=114890 RepID=A0AC35U7Q4_9BILA
MISSPEIDTDSLLYGVSLCVGASFGYATMHVPSRHFDIGNGVLAQLGTSIGIAMAAMFKSLIAQQIIFDPIAMIGGFFWAFANFCSYFVIDKFGLGVGMLLWNSSNCITGWATGHFGLFGLKPRQAKNLHLNILGLSCILISAIFFSFIQKSKPRKGHTNFISSNEYREVSTRNSLSEEESIKFNANIVKEKYLALVLAVLSGVFYATTTTPVYYVLDNWNDSKEITKPESSDYILSISLGILVTASLIAFFAQVYFGTTAVFKTRSVFLPAVFGGIIWMVSMSLMLSAIDVLAQTVTYPIMTILPGLMGSLWSVLYFQEIKVSGNHLAPIF